jgi:acetyl esterase/lipase
MSLRARLLNGACRVFGKPRLRRAQRPEPLRKHFEMVGWLIGGSARGVVERDQDAPFKARLLDPESGAADAVVLYFHGGGYIAGSPFTHRGLGRALVRATGCPLVMPVYGIGPEKPFPAAQDDARRAWDGLVAQGVDPARIVLGGDSAGGGLALSLLASLLADGQRPAAVIAFSPWTDLSGSGASHVANAASDPLFPPERLPDLVGFAAPGTDPKDPRLSPLFAQFNAPPPVLIHYSETEILRDDSLRMADVLRAGGGEVTLQSWPDTVHAWHVFHDLIPEGTEAIAQAGDFVRATLGLSRAD